jgi:hypothetical protein
MISRVANKYPIAGILIGILGTLLLCFLFSTNWTPMQQRIHKALFQDVYDWAGEIRMSG